MSYENNSYQNNANPYGPGAGAGQPGGYTQAPQGYVPPAPGYQQSSYLTQPLRVIDYIVMMLLMMVPIVNIILLFVWGFGSDVNENKKNWAKANLIIMLISIVLSLLLTIAFGAVFASLANSFSY